jgi:plastocyanin
MITPKRFLRPALILTLVATFLLAACTGDVLIIALNELNGSGQSGWAKLTASGSSTHVTLALSEGSMTSNLVHIHSGQCDSLGGGVNGLSNIADGMSSTNLEDVSLDSLLTSGFAVNTHNADDPSVYTACGSVPAMSDYVTIALGEMNGSGQSGWATLTRRGDDTEAVLFLSQGTMTSNLVHIHSGQCDSLGSITNPLTSFADGVSVTLLEGVALDSLLTGGFAVNAHSADDPSVFTACGNIPEEGPPTDMTPSPTATLEPTATAVPTTCPDSLAAQSVCLNPSKDNTLYKDDSGSISNGAGEHLFVGNNITEQTRRAVIVFDISGSIPEGSKITSVSLVMHMSRSVTDDQTVDLHRLSADWGEGTSDAPENEGRGAESTTGDATWIHRMYDTDEWETPGGDFSATVSASIPVARMIGNYTWGSTSEMVTDVQAWLDDPSSNFGWLLKGNEADFQTAKRFDSKERRSEANRPALIIAWEAPDADVPSGDVAPTATAPSPTATLEPMATAPASTPVTVEATIVNFTLPNLTVAVGTTVTWTQADGAPHTSTSGTNGQFDDQGWDSPTLSTNETFSHTFNEVGAFSYTCTIHPSMNGTVTVTAESASGDTSTGGGTSSDYDY